MVRSSLCAVMAWTALFVATSNATAQVVRVDRTDKMTDKRVVFLVAPAVDGRAAFFINCSGYSVRSFDLAALPGTVKLLTRVDRNPPVPAAGMVKPPETLMIVPSNVEVFGNEISSATRLVVRIETSTPKEFDFDWATDNKAAFSAAAEAAGGDRIAAGMGYEMLTGGASRAAGGQYATLAELLNAMKVRWRVDGRPTDTGSYIGAVMEALRRNKNKKQVEDAGNVLFGPGWTAIRALVQPDAPATYADINRPMAAQVEWLRRNCPSS